MTLLGQRTYSVERRTGERVEGLWTVSDPLTFTIDGTLRPLSAHAQAALPEGLRTKGAFKLYAELGQPVLQMTELTGTVADRVFNGATALEVHAIEDNTKHEPMNLRHHKYILTEVGGDET